MQSWKQMLTGQTEQPTDEIQADVESTDESFDISFYCITRAKDAKYLRGMLDTLPKGCECVIVNTVHDPSKDGDWTIERSEDIGGIYYIMATWYYASWDFARARNVAFGLCNRPWCFWMDTDDRLIPWQHNDIKDITTLPPGVGGVMAGCYGFQPPYDDGKRGVFYAVPQCRAHRNIPGLEWKGCVHEQIEPQIKDLGYTTVEADIGVYHVGYVTDRDTMSAKMGRNVLLLCQQISTDKQYLPDYYTTALRNNLNTYLEIKGTL